jgi:hypothetical protein
LAAEYMLERTDALKDAGQRRKNAAPSSTAFQKAVGDENVIVADIRSAQLAERRADSVNAPLIYEHVNSGGTDHAVTPKRVMGKGSRPMPRTVCAACEKFVMMVPQIHPVDRGAEPRRVEG